jgi:DNA replication protein DnaC
MNTTETLQQLQNLKLHGMAAAYKTQMEQPLHQQLESHELLAQLVQSEIYNRSNEKTTNYLKLAKFRISSTAEQIECSANRNLTKQQLAALLGGEYIQRGEPLLITGATGCGKSFLACALGHQACTQGYKTLYFNMNRLSERVMLAKLDGTYLKLLNQMEKVSLIVLDDFGLAPLDHQMKLTILQLLEDRYAKRSVIITSQLPVSKWHDYINEPTLADAILDRLTAKAHRIELKGESLRRRKPQTKTE